MNYTVMLNFEEDSRTMHHHETRIDNNLTIV